MLLVLVEIAHNLLKEKCKVMLNFSNDSDLGSALDSKRTVRF